MHAVEDSAQPWKALEDTAIAQARRKSTLFQTTRQQQRPFSVAFAGETVSVTLTATNPLAVPISLERVRLACAHVREVHGGGASTDDPPFAHDGSSSLEDLCARATAGAEAAGPVDDDLDLGPHDTREVTLHLKPQQGWLKIEGVQWEIVVPSKEQANAAADEVVPDFGGGEEGSESDVAEAATLHGACALDAPRRRCKCASPCSLAACL